MNGHSVGGVAPRGSGGVVPRVVRAPSVGRRLGVSAVWLALVVGTVAMGRTVTGRLGLPSWGAWVVVALALTGFLFSLRSLGLSPRLLRLRRIDVPLGAAWQIAANWRLHCEDAGLYAVKHGDNQQVHVYPKLGVVESTPAGVKAVVRLPGAGLTAEDMRRKAPALATALGVPVAVETVPLKPAVAIMHLQLRDPLDGVRWVSVSE